MIIFFYGSDDYRLSKAISEIKNKFTRDIDPGDNGSVVIDGQSIKLNDLISQSSTSSLFTTKRLIIINNLLDNKQESIFKNINSWLDKIKNDENIILVFKQLCKEQKNKVVVNYKGDKKKTFDFLRKQKYSQELKRLEGNALKLFIKDELQQYNKKISVTAANDLIQYYGNDLWTLSKELKKLAFALKDEVISQKDIKDNVKSSFNENIFLLIDALGAKNKNNLISLYEQQSSAGLGDEHILSSLRSHIKTMLYIKTEGDLNPNSLEIASKLGIHPFVAKKGLSQSKNFSHDDLLNYFNQLVKADYDNKKGITSIKNSLYLFFSNI